MSGTREPDLYRPFKTLFHYISVLLVVYTAGFSFSTFYLDLNQKVGRSWPKFPNSRVSISHNKNVLNYLWSFSEGVQSQFLDDHSATAKLFSDDVTKVIYNILLLMQFYLVHTGLLSINHNLKNKFRTFGDESYMSVYIVIACAQLQLIFRYWRPMNGQIFNLETVLANSIVNDFLSAKARKCLVYAILMPVHLLGLYFTVVVPSYITNFVKENPGKIYKSGIYSYIRHPIYTGLFLCLISRPSITTGSLLFAVFHAGYVLLACYLNEEPRMVDTFGEQYVEYMSEVPAYCPRFYNLKKKKGE